MLGVGTEGDQAGISVSERNTWEACQKFTHLKPLVADSNDSACSGGDPGSVPGLERCPGEGHGYPAQYPCLENPLDRGGWRATVHGVAESDMAGTWQK